MRGEEARQKGEEVREDKRKPMRMMGQMERRSGGKDRGRQMEEEGAEGMNMEMAKVV